MYHSGICPCRCGYSRSVPRTSSVHHRLIPSICRLGYACSFTTLTVNNSFKAVEYVALAAVSCFRSLAGFGFPLFAPYMYKALGYGKGDTILAALCLGVGCPALILFYIYGERIRSMSKLTGAAEEYRKEIATDTANAKA